MDSENLQALKRCSLRIVVWPIVGLCAILGALFLYGLYTQEGDVYVPETSSAAVRANKDAAYLMEIIDQDIMQHESEAEAFTLRSIGGRNCDRVETEALSPKMLRKWEAHNAKFMETNGMLGVCPQLYKFHRCMVSLRTGPDDTIRLDPSGGGDDDDYNNNDEHATATAGDGGGVVHIYNPSKAYEELEPFKPLVTQSRMFYGPESAVVQERGWFQGRKELLVAHGVVVSGSVFDPRDETIRHGVEFTLRGASAVAYQECHYLMFDEHMDLLFTNRSLDEYRSKL